MGQVTRYTPPTVNGVSNPATTYAYNKAQQLTLVTRPDTKEIRYAYDNGGRLTSMTVPRGQVSYGYSATTGQLTTVNAPHANLSYSYNGELLTGVTMNGATNGLTDGTVTFAYDKNYRITQSTVDINGNGTPITYGYDNDDALTQAGDLTLEYDPESGLLTKTTLGASTDTWEYNAFGEPMRYTGSFDNGTKRSEYIITYTRDKLGRITQKVETVDGGTIINEAYGYDAAGRLAEVRQGGAVVATYTYDANNNRLTGPNVTNADYDNQDRLLRYGDTTYTYSANGELQVKTENGQSTVYTYDVLGNLTQVLLADGTKIDYLIDGQNRRVGKQVNDQLVYTLLYQDQLNPIAQIDANGTVTRFIYGSLPHVPDYMVRGTNRYRIVSDHLGSVRYVIDLETGEAVQENRYDAWGNMVGGYNHDFQPFGFAGGLYDVETRLVRFGARDYDASIGRWTTKDPIGFAGGDTNLYGYVGGDPVNKLDISGLFNPTKGLAALINIGNAMRLWVSGSAKIATGNGFGVALGLYNIRSGITAFNRGYQQWEEAFCEKWSDATLKNLHGILLPFGEHFDDPNEPWWYEYYLTNGRELLDSPGKLITELGTLLF